MNRTWSVLPICIILLPYIYYYGFIVDNLNPVEYPDSFAYLWRQPFNFYYLTGRSLTQRVIYTLSGNHAETILIVQFTLYLTVALALYFLLSNNKSFAHKLLSALCISFLFSTYTLNASAVIINSEPIFIALLILLPFWLFLYKGPYRTVTLFAISVLFLFSKNIAPYYFILLVLMWFVTSARHVSPKHEPLKQLYMKRHVVVYSLLVLIAVGRIQITNLYDTSIDINVLNNAYRKIFVDPEAVSVFHDKYDMPSGPFVDACMGAWVGEPCLGYNVVVVNFESRNYELAEDESGFIEWVKNTGQAAYLNYLLFYDPIGTVKSYSQAFQKYASRNTIQFMIEYLGEELPTNQPNNLAKMRELGKEIGFLGFDSFSIIHNFLLLFGFKHTWMVCLYALIGWLALFRFPSIEYFPLAISLLCCSLGLFFLTYFGDGMEVKRHVFPTFVVLALGGTLYILSWLQILFSLPIMAWYLPNRNTT